MATLPPELVEIIVSEVWHSDMPSFIRASFMTTCPSINRTWKAAFAPIASRDIYIPNLAYTYYLCDIARDGKSIIYHDFIPRLTRTLTCFVDSDRYAMETAVMKVYRHLLFLPNDVGFITLFPHVPYISFVLCWTNVTRHCDIPICVRYHRYMSLCPIYEYPRPGGKTQLEVYVFLIDPDTSQRIQYPISFYNVNHCHLGNLLLFGDTRDNHLSSLQGSRHFHKIAPVYDKEGNIWEINRRLWMASKGPRRFGCLTALLHHWEYKRVQRSLLRWN
ncbi:hypothetical protein EDD85DRAFT_967377 [Armillaria nabsnona]|nr:hypothetical protein EDD85DRAFT_967377 [Armillaria nabsnona]